MGLKAQARSAAATTARKVGGAVVARTPPGGQRLLRRAGQWLERRTDAVAEPVPGPDRFPPQPPLPLPAGVTLDALDAMFRTWRIDGSPEGSLDGYVENSLRRFCHTWGLMRGQRGRCLEIGANPYFTTHLLEEYTDLDLVLANYFGPPEAPTITQHLEYVDLDGVKQARDLESHLFNIEEDRFPFPDASFDHVLFCEVVEHLLNDPVAVFAELRRVLKPGGRLVVTTPNVARLDNVLRLVAGANLYDPYSGFGPYGRHNREYNRHELVRLLQFCGFDVETHFTADSHPWDPRTSPHYADVLPLVRFREHDLGEYLFAACRATAPVQPGLPSFLYRSHPDERLTAWS